MMEPLTGSGEIKLSHPQRSSPLHSKGSLLRHYIYYVLPRVKRLLHFWAEKAGHIPDPELRSQALTSLRLKAFHCQGGAVYCAYSPHLNENLLQLIVAYQTLCDYLDNLCDRAGEMNGEAFLRLHQSLLAALDPERPHLNYYEYSSCQTDEGYILALVEKCRQCLSELPSYPLVKDQILPLVDWYNQLQVNKHLSWDFREQCLQTWVARHLPDYPGLLWNEWAAASGSTLALFALLNLASQPYLEAEQIRDTREAYFPWICGLHILLDYFIDQEEDRQGKDLNFVFYYQNQEETLERIKLFIREAQGCAGKLPTSTLDNLVVEGLLAMYLSDAKIKQQAMQNQARDLIRECGGGAYLVHSLCRLVRTFL
ncbi:MAG TPA: tetraprenyl-beta-curcumene synthase family protein [Syntrophomonadaceae bacterium]|nr:tetraprenyl-beta-curcumene synthase family protein [Syntrophomonadaceae bacterium]